MRAAPLRGAFPRGVWPEPRRESAVPGPGKGVSVSPVRRLATVTAVAVALLSAVVLALAFTASPASAFTSWAHDGATGCVCHDLGTPTDATCQACHSGFQSYPGETCWSCHAPGQDTSTLSTPSSACSQECHLWDSTQKQYLIPSTHGTNPHLGSTTDCLACHQTSVSVFDPGSSPHHSGQATGVPTAAPATRRRRSTPARSPAPRATRTRRRSTSTRPAAPASRTAAPATP